MPQRQKTPNTSARQMHRSMKRGALEQDRLNGCRCPNTRAILKTDADDPTQVSVLTQPHRDDCAAVLSKDTRYEKADPLAQRPPLAPPTDEAPPQEVDNPVDLTIVEQPTTLWTPNG